MTTRIVELRQGILKKNDELARALRQNFRSAGVLVLNLVSSPGTGKTAFLERTLRELLARGGRAAALVGDLETDNDARRLAASGAPVRQINTHGICHLDAEMIERHLTGWEVRASQQVSESASQRLVFPLRHAQQRHANLLAQIVARWAHQVAHVLNKQVVQLAQQNKPLAR